MAGGALTVAVVFPVLRGHDPRLWLVPPAIIVVGLGLVVPGVLALPHRLWLRLARAIGALIHPVVIAIVFYGTITPIAVGMRLFRRDALCLRRSPGAESYWQQHESRPVDHMRNQF